MAWSYPSGSVCGPASDRCPGSSSSGGTPPCAGHMSSSPAGQPCCCRGATPRPAPASTEAPGLIASKALRALAPGGAISRVHRLPKHRGLCGTIALPPARAPAGHRVQPTALVRPQLYLLCQHWPGLCVLPPASVRGMQVTEHPRVTLATPAQGVSGVPATTLVALPVASLPRVLLRLVPCCWRGGEVVNAVQVR